MYSNGKINQFFMVYTVLVVLKCHCTEIHILHGRVNLMKKQTQMVLRLLY